MMFEIGAVLKYGASGIYRLTEIKQMEMAGQKQDYLVLQSVSCTSTVAYIPAKNAALTAKLYPLLSQQEATALVEQIPSMETFWINADKERADRFKQVLEGEDRGQIAAMIRSLRCRRAALSQRNKKLRSADESIMNRAEKLLFDELSLSISITPNSFYALFHTEE